MSETRIRIATRSSQLALWQAEHVKTLIHAARPDVSVEIIHVNTIGDRNQTDALRQFGGTGVFTKEVQNVVLSADCDIAVHSLKDLPTLESSGLLLAGIPGRANVFDALLLPEGNKIGDLSELPAGARIGTGSPRRQAQLAHARGDLTMREIRGNVDTRIRKLDEGEYDAIVLAQAGLKRLGLDDRISLTLQPPLMYPAVGQGAIGIECRTDDTATISVLEAISEADVVAAATAERALLQTLRAGCHAPLGCFSKRDGDELTLTGVLLSVDGVQRLEATAAAAVSEAEALGQQVAQSLLDLGGEKLLAAAS
ncbi:MAG: hydroxymethylbilane synthase [Planctomycetaceae bacterium]|nr:hydroxymethylbilane synthase [Planctomycetaceae bacterium]